jgi:hypothetical protein
MKVTKEESVKISLAAVASWIPLVPFLWFVFQPILVTAVSEAMADQIQMQIKQEVAPISAAFTVLVKRDIADLRRLIAEQEFIRDNPPDGDWTADDAEDLVNLVLELEGSQEALSALQGGPDA